LERISSMVGKGLSGWELVALHMDRQLESGKSTPKAWQDYLNGEPYQLFDMKMRPLKDKSGALVIYRDPPIMQSWLHFETWRREHPDATVPASVRRIRSDEQHWERASAGFPEMDAREEFIQVHRGRCSANCTDRDLPILPNPPGRTISQGPDPESRQGTDRAASAPARIVAWVVERAEARR